MTTMDRVRKHYNKVKEFYNEDQILGVFLYGSQNYHTNTKESDVDTKAILIPTLEDLCLRRPVSKELHLDNGEHCEVKDIREMVKMFKKQNINFLEILFTEYCIINPKYNALWRKYFVNNADYIAHYDVKKAILSLTGQGLHTLKQNPYDTDVFHHKVSIRNKQASIRRRQHSLHSLWHSHILKTDLVQAGQSRLKCHWTR